VRASERLFHHDSAHTAPEDDGKKIDVWFAYMHADLDNARTIAEALDARGYTSAPGIVLNHHDKPQTHVTPQQARCVVALWTPDATEDQQVQADARTAGLQGKLIEVGYRKGAPKERYSGDALIVFNRLDPHSDGTAWRVLFARILEHCGEPKKKPSEFRRYAPAALASLAGVAAIAGGAQFYSQQASHHQEQQALKESWTQPAGMIEPTFVEARKRPSLTPTTDLALAGGPTPADQAEFDVDKGTAPVGLPPASTAIEAPKPVAVERGEQGPEQ